MLRIELVRIGKIDDSLLRDIATGISETYRPLVRDCKSTMELEIPQEAFNPDREQYRASDVVEHLGKNVKHSKKSKILGITGEDLYSRDLNFVFGQARCPGSSAVISLNRLDPTFYGQRPNEEIFLNRAVKEAVHELGHTFGLGHCGDPKCVMSFSNSILDVDRKRHFFCKDCRERLGL